MPTKLTNENITIAWNDPTRVPAWARGVQGNSIIPNRVAGDNGIHYLSGTWVCLETTERLGNAHAPYRFELIAAYVEHIELDKEPPSIEDQIAAVDRAMSAIEESHRCEDGTLPADEQREVDCLRAAIGTLTKVARYLAEVSQSSHLTGPDEG